MILLHSTVKAWRNRFGGRLKEGEKVYHFISNLPDPDGQRRELIDFVLEAKLPASLLSNPHLTKSRRPHLDIWGKPGVKSKSYLEASKLMGKERMKA